MYSDRLVDHFTNPRNVGALDDANGVATVGDPGCGDFLRMYLRVEEMRIVDISFLCKGCPAAIASASATTELAKGKLLKEAMYLMPEDVSEYLGGMPSEKMHCSNLGVVALRFAMADYLGIRDGDPDKRETEERQVGREKSRDGQASDLEVTT